MTALYEELMRLTKERLVQYRPFVFGGRSLAIFKYHRRVFYDNLWASEPLLEWARGLVVDVELGVPVSIPFRKVYNYGENGAGEGVPASQEVVAVEKKNGFLAVASVVEDQLLVTTSGTHDSPYADLARRELAEAGVVAESLSPGYTYMFEVCSAEDLHVIPDRGVFFIGQRGHYQGLNTPLLSESSLDVTYRLCRARGLCMGRKPFWHGVLRPAWRTEVLSRALELARDSEGEGYMIRVTESGEPAFKVKSRRYLALKYLSRSTWFLKEGVTRDQLRQNVEEEFYPLVDKIFEVGQEKFRAMSDLERLEVLERSIR